MDRLVEQLAFRDAFLKHGQADPGLVSVLAPFLNLLLRKRPAYPHVRGLGTSMWETMQQVGRPLSTR